MYISGCPHSELPEVLNSVLQLVWGLNTDLHLKAWTCGSLSCQIAAAAGKIQVLCGNLYLQTNAHSSVLFLCSCWHEVYQICFFVQDANQNTGLGNVWADRCVSAATLGMQILNHPGIASHAVLAPPTHAIPTLGLCIFLIPC